MSLGGRSEAAAPSLEAAGERYHCSHTLGLGSPCWGGAEAEGQVHGEGRSFVRSSICL
jgi:hypothetical protein